MLVVESTQEVPLNVEPDGTIRIAESRVSLDSIVYHYRNGATVEEIAQRFPGLHLADLHASIAYFLNHQQEVDEYLEKKELSAAELRERISTDPVQQTGVNDMRVRIKARLSERLKTP